MRAVLNDFMSARPTATARAVPTQTRWTTRGAGHLHLNPELFLQVQGHTEFRFPEGQLTLRAGQALLMPPKLLHDEWSWLAMAHTRSPTW